MILGPAPDGSVSHAKQWFAAPAAGKQPAEALWQNGAADRCKHAIANSGKRMPGYITKRDS